jgi:hypothetical protein
MYVCCLFLCGNEEAFVLLDCLLLLTPVPLCLPSLNHQVGVQTEVSPEKAVESNLEDKVNAVLPLQNSRDDRP